jgi:hypothetical protein
MTKHDWERERVKVLPPILYILFLNCMKPAFSVLRDLGRISLTFGAEFAKVICSLLKGLRKIEPWRNRGQNYRFPSNAVYLVDANAYLLVVVLVP